MKNQESNQKLDEQGMVSLRPSDATAVPSLLEYVNETQATALASTTIEDALSMYRPPNRIDDRAEVDLKFRPVQVYLALSNEYIPKYGSRAVNLLCARAWGLALEDKALAEHADLVSVFKKQAMSSSRAVHVEASQIRYYSFRQDIIPLTRTKYHAWSPEVVSGMSSIADKNSIRANVLWCVYLSTALLDCGLDLDTVGEELRNEAKSWQTWLLEETDRMRRWLK